MSLPPPPTFTDPDELDDSDKPAYDPGPPPRQPRDLSMLTRTADRFESLLDCWTESAIAQPTPPPITEISLATHALHRLTAICKTISAPRSIFPTRNAPGITPRMICSCKHDLTALNRISSRIESLLDRWSEFAMSQPEPPSIEIISLGSHALHRLTAIFKTIDFLDSAYEQSDAAAEAERKSHQEFEDRMLKGILIAEPEATAAQFGLTESQFEAAKKRLNIAKSAATAEIADNTPRPIGFAAPSYGATDSPRSAPPVPSANSLVNPSLSAVRPVPQVPLCPTISGFSPRITASPSLPVVSESRLSPPVSASPGPRVIPDSDSELCALRDFVVNPPRSALHPVSAVRPSPTISAFSPRVTVSPPARVILGSGRVDPRCQDGPPLPDFRDSASAPLFVT